LNRRFLPNCSLKTRISFLQIFAHVPLVVVHPAGDVNIKEANRFIAPCWHKLAALAAPPISIFYLEQPRQFSMVRKFGRFGGSSNIVQASQQASIVSELFGGAERFLRSHAGCCFQIRSVK
jgi:hypothetical protein